MPIVKSNWKGCGAPSTCPSVCWEITKHEYPYLWRLLVFQWFSGPKYELHRWHASKDPDAFSSTYRLEGEEALKDAENLGLNLQEVAAVLPDLEKKEKEERLARMEKFERERRAQKDIGFRGRWKQFLFGRKN